MFKSQILRIYRGYDTYQIGTEKNHKKEFDAVTKCEKKMLEKIGDDVEFKKLFNQFDMALNDLNYADLEDVFQEGFILGARLAMEICGVKCDED